MDTDLPNEEIPEQPVPESPAVPEQVTPSSVGRIEPDAARIFSDSDTAQQKEFQPPVADTDHEVVKPGKRRFPFGTVLFIVLLFGLGMWLSVQFRSFFAPATSRTVIVPTIAPDSDASSFFQPGETGSLSAVVPPVNDEWATYTIRGRNGSVISGVTYKLPATVAAPVCDGTSCPSQGTNLPGGTRLTVAARGTGQLLPDFRGAILTDTTGKEFAMENVTIGSVAGYGYRGDFTGRTSGGYTFTAMRGILVPVNEDLAIDFNFFAPAGVISDFAADGAIFDQIIASFSTDSQK